MRDVFGKALMTYYRRGSAEYVIERDDGTKESLSAGEYFADYEQWPSHEKEAILGASGRVLDVGCGAGRAVLWMQGRRLKVTAIDISPLALKVASLRGVKKFRYMDVRRLGFPESSFDTVVMFGNNFGIAGDVKKTQLMLGGLHRVTSENGRIIATSKDPLKTDNPAHLAYHEMNRRRGAPPGLVRIRIGFQGEFDDWFDLLLVGEDEMREIAASTGWAVRATYADGANYSAVLTKT